MSTAGDKAAALRTDDGRAPTGPKAVVRCLADISSQAVRWLWPGRIVRGKLNMIAGDPGLGKSFVTLDIAARVSVGVAWPDIPGAQSETASVILLSAEDDAGDTIRPRLEAMGGDVRRVHVLEAVRLRNDRDGKPQDVPFSLASDLPRLEEELERLSDCRLVIIDPISAYLGETDSHKNAEVRSLLTPLSALAARTGAAMVLVSHLNKGGAAGSSLYRITGSLAFPAAARVVWLVTRDEDDPARRLMLPGKNNLAKDLSGLAFRFCSSSDPEVPVIAWDSEPVVMHADEILAERRKRKQNGGGEKLREAVAFLQQVLADGPQPVTDVTEQSKACGITHETLRRARESLGIRPRKTGLDAGWVWELPVEDVHQPFEPD